MSRYEYLKTLESHLKLSLSRNEINDILRDYGEYFTEGEKQGKSEWEIIAKLGDPKDVAQQIISESNKEENQNLLKTFFTRFVSAIKNTPAVVGKFLKTLSGKITVVLLLLLCAPLWVGALTAILGIISVFFGGLLAFFFIGVLVVLSGITAVVTTSLFITAFPFSVSLLLFVFSIGLIAGGILGLSLLVIIFNWGVNHLKYFFKWLKKYFTSRTDAHNTLQNLNTKRQEGEAENG